MLQSAYKLHSRHVYCRHCNDTIATDMVRCVTVGLVTGKIRLPVNAEDARVSTVRWQVCAVIHLNQ